MLSDAPRSDGSPSRGLFSAGEHHASVAQTAALTGGEHHSFKVAVAGSSPAGSTSTVAP